MIHRLHLDPRRRRLRPLGSVNKELAWSLPWRHRGTNGGESSGFRHSSDRGKQRAFPAENTGFLAYSCLKEVTIHHSLLARQYNTT